MMDISKLNTFSDSKSYVAHMTKFVFKRIENIVGKEKMLVCLYGVFKNLELTIRKDLITLKEMNDSIMFSI